MPGLPEKLLLITAFTDKVIEIVGEKHFRQHKHLLESLHPAHRNRYIHTLTLGFNMPQTDEHIKRAGRLPELNYLRYIKFMRAQGRSPADY